MNMSRKDCFNADFVHPGCLKSYLNEAAFQAHQITHQGNTLDKRFDAKSQQKQRTSANETKEDHNFCNLNNKTATIQPDSETDTDSTCKKCEICNASFILASHLNIHTKLEHNNKQPGSSSRCEFASCGMEFSKSKEYINHFYIKFTKTFYEFELRMR
ncbi:unnamed protein product [Orchesella dallaii]|uniref:C2H2-type domain-containing protein n=1 Tax=Orchesella dallaii TaxID=48710 RepID=A0ABP1PLS0_9HEXA